MKIRMLPHRLRFIDTPPDPAGSGGGSAELDKVKADLAKLQTEHAATVKAGEEAAKTATEATKQLTELQAKADADRTAHEAKIAEYEAKLAAANQTAWKAEATATHGLKPELAKFLTGTSKEEFDKAAKELAEATKLAKPTDPDPSFTQPLQNTPSTQDTFTAWAQANL